MEIITKTGHVKQKNIINHNASEGDEFIIQFKPNGGNLITILHAKVENGENVIFEVTATPITFS